MSVWLLFARAFHDSQRRLPTGRFFHVEVLVPLLSFEFWQIRVAFGSFHNPAFSMRFRWEEAH